MTKRNVLKILALCCLLSGPVAQAQNVPSTSYSWRNVEIGGGGFVTGLIFHATQKDLLYARTDIGGAYRWNAQSKRWMPLNDAFGGADWNLYGIESLALDPTDINRVYIAAGTYTNDWAGYGAVLRSTDQGKTWQRTDLPFKNGGNQDGRSMGERLVVDPAQPNRVFFGTRTSGLWKSEDHGATWSKVASFPKNADDSTAKDIGISFVIFGLDNAIYAGVADRTTNLYRSRDGGQTWDAVKGQPRGFLPHHGVFDSDGTLYLTYGDGPGPNGMKNGAVWKYKRGQWREITPVKPTEKNGFGYAGLAVDAAQRGTIMVATMDRWGAGDDIFRSRNGGKTWQSLKKFSQRDASASPFLKWTRAEADLGHWIGDLEIDPFNSDHALYVTGATIWGTDDLRRMDEAATTSWTPRAQGLEETSVLDLISPPEGAPLISAMRDLGGFVHDDLTVSPAGGVWKNPTYSNTDSLDFGEKAACIIVRSGSGGKDVRRIAYSLDSGKTWQPFISEPEGAKGSGPLAISADGQSVIWTPSELGPYLTRTFGGTWQACQGPQGTLQNNAVVVADRENPQWFYALGEGTLLFSDDSGATFSPRATKLPGGKLRAVAGRAGDIWLCSGSNGLHHSTDGGATFSKLPSVHTADTLGFGKAAPNQTYPALYLSGRIGDVNGVFRSNDGGKNWLRINDDAHQFGYIGKVVSGDPRVYGRVYLGTNGRGILVADPKTVEQ